MSDFQIYRSGTHTYLKNSSNTLVLNSDAISLTNHAGNSNRIVTAASGEVYLYYSDAIKLVTTNTGVVVTGICTATNVSVASSVTAATFHGNGEGLTYTSPLSHRNMIINGDMRVAQRATSASMSNAGNTYDVCDRWQYNRNGVTATLAQVAEAPAGSGFTKSLKLTTTSTLGSIAVGNMLAFAYRIETQDVKRLGYGSSSAKTATVSFWVRGSLSGKIGVNCARDSRTFSAGVDLSLIHISEPTRPY